MEMKISAAKDCRQVSWQRATSQRWNERFASQLTLSGSQTNEKQTTKGKFNETE
jgi:hypothetical protein